MLELLLIGVLLGSGLVVWQERRQSKRLARIAAQLERTAALKADLRWWQESLQNLSQWQEVTESSIHGGTKAVRALHKGIASVPFGILEAIPATRDTTRVVRSIHDFTSDNVYAAVSAVNRLVGSHSRRLIDGEPARSLPNVDADEALTAGSQRSPADVPSRNGH